MEEKPGLAFTEFVRRQTKESGHSHWEISDLDLLERVSKAEWRPGYRIGVTLARLDDPSGFFSPVVTLKEGDQLAGSYRSRVPGEEPRKSIGVVRPGEGKTPAVEVDVVLYSLSVLEEDPNGEPPQGLYNVVAVLAKPFEGEQPMDPETLIANHFQLSGGTATGMTPEQFEAALRASVMFWKNRAMLKTEPTTV